MARLHNRKHKSIPKSSSRSINYSTMFINCCLKFEIRCIFGSREILRRNWYGSLFFFFSHSLRIYSQVILEFEAVFDQWDFFLQSLRFILNTRHILSQQFFNIPIRFFSLVWNFLVFKLKRIREMLQFSFRQALNSIFKYSIFVWSFY